VARATLDAAAGPVIGERRAPVEMAIVLADDLLARRLNREYRGVDKPTNVLSFGGGGEPGPLVRQQPVILGDVLLAYETVAAEATTQGKTLVDHASHLVAHGTLHLLGYDHRSVEEAEAMEAIEIEVLAGFGIADPYRPRKMRRRGRRRP
jgi:probable rRNA maturation factor